MAVRHQNIIGWDNFVKGFILTKCNNAFIRLSSHDISSPSSKRDNKLMAGAMELFKGIGRTKTKQSM
jgi:hypothetical protein